MSNEFIRWNDLYSLGIEKIDNQHKKLIEIINKIFDFLSEEKAEVIIPEIIKELKDYTQYHFKTEEDLFEQYDYPDTEDHRLKHQEFIDMIGKWSNEIKNNKNILYEMMNFLRKWLLEHILHDDRAYGKFFKDNNIQIN